MAANASTQPTYPTDGGCIFCKIVAGQIPCYKVYEDAQMLAFLDIGPIVAGHTLLIPKGHYASIMDVPEAVSACLLYTSPSPRDRTRSRMPSSA